MPDHDHLMAPRMDHEVANGDRGRVRLRTVRVPAQDRLDAGQKHARTERLGHVVGRAQLQTGDDICLAALRGQHDDGDVLRRRIALEHPADLQTIHAGQHEVEDENVRQLRASGTEGVLSGSHREDFVAFFGQVVLDELEDVLFVVYDQHVGTWHRRVCSSLDSSCASTIRDHC